MLILAAPIVLSACGSSASKSTAQSRTSIPQSSDTNETYRSPASSIKQTTVEVVGPIDAAGQLAPNLKITKNGRGSCWENSMADPSSTIWRCFLGNYIFDPCFSNSYGQSNTVYCMNPPWDTSVTEIRLTAALPKTDVNTPQPGGPFPWGMEFVNGTKCVINTGTGVAIGNINLNYICGKNGFSSSLNQKVQLWTAFYDASPNSSVLTSVKVKIAWY